MTGPLDATVRPVLYSFRRCPYAMRARLAIICSSFEVELREIILRDKPAHMVQISPKATVPVLQLPDGGVIDESRDVMNFVLGENDPQGLLSPKLKDLSAMLNLMDENDSSFKHHLDRYKYPNRYDLENGIAHRDLALEFLSELNVRLTQNSQLFGARLSLADIGIFPFVRQFANVNRDWFDALEMPALKAWLTVHLESELFAAIMPKFSLWNPDDEALIFGV